VSTSRSRTSHEAGVPGGRAFRQLGWEVTAPRAAGPSGRTLRYDSNMDENLLTQEPTVPAPAATWPARISRVLRIAFFILLGAIFSVATAFAAPSFWYVPAAILLFVSGFLWIRPRLGASASLPLCLVLLFMMVVIKFWHWPYPAVLDGVAGILLLMIGAVLCLVEVSRPAGHLETKPFAIVVALIFVGFIADRAFTNRVEVRSLQMNWVAEGKDPIGDPAELSTKGEKPIYVFTNVPRAVCYDVIFSEPLRQRLAALNKPLVKVEYNEFRTWGRITSYNIRSIAGMQFNQGRNVLIPNPEGFGGTMLTSDKTDAVSFDAPPCPR